MADQSLTDFSQAVKELAKAQRETNDTLKTVGQTVGKEVVSAGQSIISPFTSALSQIPGFKQFTNITKILGKQLVSKVKEKREMEILRMQLGLSKTEFKNKIREKKLQDAQAKHLGTMESAAQSLLGMSKEEVKKRRLEKPGGAKDKEQKLRKGREDKKQQDVLMEIAENTKKTSERTKFLGSKLFIAGLLTAFSDKIGTTFRVIGTFLKSALLLGIVPFVLVGLKIAGIVTSLNSLIEGLKEGKGLTAPGTFTLAGMALGSILFPGVGTVIGGILGYVLGQQEWAQQLMSGELFDLPEWMTKPAIETLGDIGGKAGIAAFDLVQNIKSFWTDGPSFLPDWMRMPIYDLLTGPVAEWVGTNTFDLVQNVKSFWTNGFLFFPDWMTMPIYDLLTGPVAEWVGTNTFDLVQNVKSFWTDGLSFLPDWMTTPIDELLKDIGEKTGGAVFDLVQKIKDLNAKIEEYLPDWMTTPIDELLKDIGSEAGLMAFDLKLFAVDLWQGKIGGKTFLPDWMTKPIHVLLKEIGGMVGTKAFDLKEALKDRILGIVDAVLAIIPTKLDVLMMTRNMLPDNFAFSWVRGKIDEMIDDEKLRANRLRTVPTDAEAADRLDAARHGMATTATDTAVNGGGNTVIADNSQNTEQILTQGFHPVMGNRISQLVDVHSH